MICGLEDIE